MDPRRFDALTRTIGLRRSRRAALAMLPALLGLGIATDATAAKCSKRKPCGPCRRCKKGRCRKARDGAACPGGTCQTGRCVGGCTPSCDRRVCGDDGCGGSCGSCEPGQTCQTGRCQVGPCTPSCAGRACGDDGCGGSCGSCPGGQSCQGGRCVTADCPPGQRRCRGQCLAVTICCDDTDCAGDRTCQSGTCACPGDKPNLCSDQICRQCCGNTDCNPFGDPVVNTCISGVCTCKIAGDRYCPRRRFCGTCCGDADCAGGLELCIPELTSQAGRRATCYCRSGIECVQRCVEEECYAFCAKTCTSDAACGRASGCTFLSCLEEAPGIRRCLPNF
jgi:hypothetical protein